MKNILKTISRFLTGYRRLLLLLLISLSLQDKSFAQVVVNSSADVVAAAPAASANTAGGAVTIRSAIQYANLHPGTTITFAAALNGTPLTLTIAGINENNAATGDLDILAAVTITGNGPANTIIQAGTTSANGIDKVFSINPLFTTAFATNISGITIRFGKNASAFSGDGFGGGLDWEGSGTGTLIINNCVITDNSTADGDGGGMTLTNSTAGGGSATITNSTISNNRPARAGAASPVGGGVFIGTATSVFMTNCTISGNNTSGSGGNGQGGGIFIFGPSGAGGQPSLTNCIISNNTSPGDGGGIISTAPLTINATTFSGNNSGRFGGGLFINHSNATTTISENTFINNNATTRGGAMYLGSSTTANILNVSYSRFVGNTSAAQNGVAIDGGAGTLQNNWWGCNQGPSNAACNQAAVFGAGSINFTPWLVLNHTPSSAVLCSGANTTLTASFLLNSGGGAVAASNLDVLIGLPITFNAPVNGTLSGAQSAIQANGNATVTFTATTAGNGTANAVFVPATENVTVTTSPAITINTCCVTNPIVTTNANAGAGSLRQAVLDACPGSTITFDMAQVTSPILLSDGQIILNKNLTIQGPGANLLTVQNTAAVSATSRVFLVNSGVTASISGLTISGGNLSLSEGGGIKNEGILTVTNSTLSGNSTGIVGNGGAIFSDGTLTVSNSTFINNSASSDGGAIFSNGGTLSDCTFSGNSAPGGFGGAIYAAGNTWSITRSTFTNNSAVGAGGAIYNANISAMITNSTFTSNSSGNAGGAVANVGFQLTMINCSFFGNTVSNPGRGGALFTSIDGPLTLKNSIVASSTNGNFNAGTGGITGVPVTDGGGNLKDDNTGPVTITQVTLAQLALSPIANNGGPTQTIALGTGSVAINAGNNANAAGLTTDQRGTGFPRISPVAGTVDVGAYEFGCINNPVVTNNLNSGAGSLRQAVLDACPGSTITFDMAQVTSPISLSAGRIILDKNLTIQGPGLSLLTVQNTAAASVTSYIFHINNGVTATISGLTISGGNVSNDNDPQAGGINNYGTLILNNSYITNNTASGTNSENSGGGILNYTGNLTVNNSTISGNTGLGDYGTGGGILNYGLLSVNNSVIALNTVTSDGGGIYNDGNGGGAATINITNSTISGNIVNGAYNSGGGIYNKSGAISNLTNSTITNNTAAAGGGIINNDGTVNALNCIIAGNTAGVGPDFLDQVTSLGNNLIGKTDGSSGWIASDFTGTIASPLNPLLGALANNGGPTQTHALQQGSPAIDKGSAAGGITTDQRGLIRPVDFLFYPNATSGNGSDIGAYEAQCITNPVVTNNLNAGAGSLRQAVLDACPGSTITFDMAQVTSPISLSAGQIILNKNLTIEGPGANLLTVQNTAAQSFASRVFIINSGVTANISGLTISGGNTSGNGGGIFNNSGGTVNITNSTISNNSATGSNGGGIFNNGGGTVNLTNSTISNNSVSGGGLGGGICNNAGGTVNLTNSTISNNSATGATLGGGIFNNGGGTLTVTNSTISNNSTTGGGGGIHNNTGTVNSLNSIIAGNTAPTVPDFAGTVVSQGFNLVGKTDGSSGFTQPTDLKGTVASPLDPLLGALANNGGPTMTHALLPGSPAINTGNNTGAPATDQRGIIRPQQTTTDIGAFESRGFTMTISGGNNQTTVINTAFAIPLVVTVASAFSEPVDGGKVTFTPPASGASSTIAVAGNPATITGGIATTGTVTANATVGGPYAVAAGASGVSSGVNFSLTNTAIPTTTVITSNLNPSCFGSAVTFTATVTSGGNPVTTGTVNFTEGVTPLASNVSLNGSGQATFITSSLTAGGHTITATYNGTASFATSNGSTGQTVTALPAITLNAPVVIQPTCAVPTGTITVSATTASGLLEYSIDNGVTWQLNPTFNSLAFSSLAPGSYFVRVRLQGGSCSIAYTNNPIVLNVPTCPGKTIPGRIEAESFDAKNGPQYGVPTDDAGGGQHVIGITNGSWMDYNVLVTQAGLYTVTFRVATTQNNPQFQIKLGSTVLGVVNITNTGGWSNWQNVSVSNIALTAGSKTIRIQSVNNETCNFNWTDWVVAGANTAPTATAGPNQSIVQPASQVTLAGSGIANNGGSISSHVWSKFSGPAGGNVTDPNSYTTTVTALQVGTYVFRLTVTQDDNQTATSDVTIVVNPSSGKFIPGRVEAEAWDTKSGPQYAVPTSDAGGGQQVIGMNNGAWLDYNVNVTQTGAYTVYFRVATTQNNVQFQIKSGATVLATVNIPNTGGWDTWMSVPVTNVALTAGIQTLRIQQSSNESCNFNWMDWSLTGPTTAPTANAGPNQNIILPITQVTMAGSGTANNPGGFILSHIWSKLSGGTANITDPANYNTTITGLSIGTYVFRLTVNQNDGQTATADVTVTVGSIPAPTVNAGPAQTITLPANQVTLAGSGSAGAGGTITHVWSKFSGGTASITDPSNYGTTVTGLAAGTYVFRLTVNQNDGQTAFSDVTITVNPAAGNGKTIPGKIEAEAWDAKAGPQYAVPTADAGGGQQIIGMTNGSWLDYNVTVLQTGSYTVNFRIATTQNNAQFQVKLGATVLGTINVPNTGGWDTWQTVALNNVSLTAGVQTIRIQLSSNESCNFNWTNWVFGAPPIAPLTITIAEQPARADVTTNKLAASVFPNPASSYFNLRVQTKSMEQVTVRILDIAGRQVQQLKGNPGQTMRFGDKMVNGTYFVEVRQGAEKVVLKVMKQ